MGKLSASITELHALAESGRIAISAAHPVVWGRETGMVSIVLSKLGVIDYSGGRHAENPAVGREGLGFIDPQQSPGSSQLAHDCRRLRSHSCLIGSVFQYQR